ncbi:MAG: hypothetical protein R3A50_02480 [Saprospiraceae bacterium]|nr:hypothetical protein [Saprospiraceae bacterium]MCB9343946.1 hypothetical protein [Lewinellaceae bacterium]
MLLLLLATTSSIIAQSPGYLAFGSVPQTPNTSGYFSCDVGWYFNTITSPSGVYIQVTVSSAGIVCLDQDAIKNSVASPFSPSDVAISGSQITIAKSSGLTNLPSTIAPLITVYFKGEPDAALTVQGGPIDALLYLGQLYTIGLQNSTNYTMASAKSITGLIRKAPQPDGNAPPECDGGSNIGIPEIDVEFDAQAACYPGTDPFDEHSYDGYFEGFVAPNHSFVITPAKDAGDTECDCGVGEEDIDIIHDWLLDLEAPESLQQLLAADFNASGSITPYDQYNMSQCMLGTFSPPTGWNPWIFVPKTDYNNNNPPSSLGIPSLPSNITTSLVTTNLINQNFYGIKRGDILEQDCTECGDALMGDLDDRSMKTTEMYTENMSLYAGQHHLIPLTLTAENEGASVFSLELFYDDEEIDVISFEKPEHSNDWFLVQNIVSNGKNSVAKMIWFSTDRNGAQIENGQAFINVRITARKDIQNTKDLFWQKNNGKLNHIITRKLKRSLILSPTDNVLSGYSVRLTGANPTSSSTTLTIFSPESTHFLIRLLDVNVKNIKEVHYELSKGWNRIFFNADGSLPGAYILQTSSTFGFNSFHLVKQ